jgi:VanZ family protein
MGPRRRKDAIYLISFLLYLGIFLLSSFPAYALPANIPDIIPHFCEYVILAFFFIQIFNDPASLKIMACGFAWLVLLGLLDELHQTFVPGRFFSLKDLLFDAFGIFAGIMAYLILRRWSAKTHASKWVRRLGDYLSRP